MVELGDKVKDTVTGFEGIVVAETKWLNGCVRFGVQSDKLKDGLPTEPQWVDEHQLKVLSKGKAKQGPRDPGGPIPTPKRSANPAR